jgi:hypothetical protein
VPATIRGEGDSGAGDRCRVHPILSERGRPSWESHAAASMHDSAIT